MEMGKVADVVVPPLDNAAAAQIVCRFYRYGTCRFGSTCRFIHPEPEPATLGSSCGSSSGSSSSSSSSGSSYHTSNSISAGSSPEAGDGAVPPAAPSDATEQQIIISQQTSTVDLSRWIDAPVFVPKSKLPEQQQQQQLEQQQTRKCKRGKSGQRSAQKKGTANVEQQSKDEELGEEEEEEKEELDEDERDNEADNEADNEEEEEEEDDDEDEEDGAVGGLPSLSYANVVTMNNNHNGGKEEDQTGLSGEARLCVHYRKHGVCPLTDCVHVHGELCELCQRYCLDPRDKEQQRRHNADCIREHELEMEHAFAVQRSRDKSCGICLEVVMEKRVREQRFGILPNCKHIFCLSCIRTWRKANNFANKIKRGCPTCRIPSDFVCPSFVWVEAGEEKERLIENYKQACSNTDCMHFKKGTANCPFGNKCFYRHALPSGELVDLGAPSRRRNPNRSRDHMEAQQLQEIFATLLAPRSWIMGEYMTSVFSDLEDDSGDDLDRLGYFLDGHGFDYDWSDYEDDLLFDIV